MTITKICRNCGNYICNIHRCRIRKMPVCNVNTCSQWRPNLNTLLSKVDVEYVEYEQYILKEM